MITELNTVVVIDEIENIFPVRHEHHMCRHSKNGDFLNKAEEEMNIDKNSVSTECMIPIDSISTLTVKEYTDEVLELAASAQAYLSSFSWCDDIITGWLDYACGYVICVFYFQIRPSRVGVPITIWIIVGDLPYAYIDAETCHSGVDAVCDYINAMQEWVDRVIEGRLIDETVMPVNVPPNREWADRLNRRLSTLRRHFVENYDGE